MPVTKSRRRHKRSPKTEPPGRYILADTRSNPKRPLYVADPAKVLPELPTTPKRKLARVFHARNNVFNFLKRRPKIKNHFRSIRLDVKA